jgi:hypothetical protein
LAAFQDYEISRSNWFGTEGWYDLAIARRTWPAVSGDSSLLHFDGAVMQGYSHPTKASEVIFCRGNPDSKYCDRESFSLPDPEQALHHPFRAGDEFNPAADRSPISMIRSTTLHRVEHIGKNMTISYFASGGDVLSVDGGEAGVVRLYELKSKKEH